MPKNIVIAKLDIDTQALVDSAQKTAKEIQTLTEQQDKLARKGKEGSEQFIANEAALKSLTVAHKAQTAALSAQTTEDGRLVSVKKAVKEATDQVNQSENDYLANNQRLLALKKQLNSSDDDYEKRLAAINGKMQENNNWLNENGSAHAKLITTMNDYKQQVADSFQQINIFNGGLSGFISRAQEAGGVGPLVKGAFEGMAGGIGGMTKSALAFMATPLGAALTVITALLSPIIDYLTNTEEGIDAVTSVTRPLQSVFQALSGVFQQVGKFLFEAFSNPKKSMEELYEFVKQNLINRFTAFGTILEGIMTMDFKKISNGVLQAATGVEDVIGKTQNAAKATGQFFDEAVKKGQQIDALQKQLDKSQADYTSKMSALSLELDKQKDIANDTNLTHAEREKAAVKAIELAKEQNKLALERMDTEIHLAQLKMSENGSDSKEKQQLEEMKTKRNEAEASYKKGEQDLYNSLDSIRQDAHDKDMKRRQQALDDALTKQKQLLALYVAENTDRTKTLEEQLKYEDQVAAKSVAILKSELKAKKISQTEYDTEIFNLTNQTLRKKAQLTVEHAKAEANLWQQENKSKITAESQLTEALVAAENERLLKAKEQNIKLLELEHNLDAETIKGKRKRNETLTTDQATFLAGIYQIENDFAIQKAANETKLRETQEESARQKIQAEAEQNQADYEAKMEQAEGRYQEQLTIEGERHTDELATLKALLDNKLISEQDYNTKVEEENKKTEDNKTAINKAAMDNKLSLANQTFGNLATIMGKESTAGKAMAVAQATIDTYKAATAAYSAMSGIPIVGPALGAVAAAAAVAAGIANVKKITSTKPPKAEKGALFGIGGNRHSAGGTLFTGADGTQFEAEQGELIGVMNRNAARHFMAFNNAFPAGGASAPNYFAGGGIVSREIAQQTLNTDELALKIAEANKNLPPPVVAVQDIITEGNSHVRVRDAANF